MGLAGGRGGGGGSARCVKTDSAAKCEVRSAKCEVGGGVSSDNITNAVLIEGGMRWRRRRSVLTYLLVRHDVVSALKVKVLLHVLLCQCYGISVFFFSGLGLGVSGVILPGVEAIFCCDLTSLLCFFMSRCLKRDRLSASACCSFLLWFIALAMDERFFRRRRRCSAL